MKGNKPQVVYFSDEYEMVDLVRLTLSDRFDVTPVTGIVDLDDALGVLRRVKPDFVIVDPNLVVLDHQQLNRRIKADEELKGTQILIVREET